MTETEAIWIFVAFVATITLSAAVLMFVSEYTMFHMGRGKRKRK